MYTCSSCQKSFDEFDRAFNSQLRNRKSEEELMCFKCTIKKGVNGEKAYKAFEKAEKAYSSIKWHKYMLVLQLIIIVVPLVTGILYYYGSLNLENDEMMSGIVLFAISGLGGIYTFIFPIFSLIFGYNVVKGFGFKDPEPYKTGRKVLEIEFDTYDDSKATARITDEYAGGGCLASLINIVLVITYSVWYIPHWIYVCVATRKKLQRVVPTSIVDAWYYARKTAPIISKKGKK